MDKLSTCLAIIDSASEWLGKAAKLGPPLLMLVVVYDVAARYLFNRPTIWAFDISQFLFLTTIALGSGFAILYQTHVRTDIIYNCFKARGKAIIEIILAPISLLFMFVVVYMVFQMMADSVSTREHLVISALNPPLYPIKVVLFIGVLLALLQGVATLIRNLVTVLTGKSESKGKGETPLESKN